MRVYGRALNDVELAALYQNGLACAANQADCNANANDGCEIDLLASTANCGACGQACSNAHGTTSCSGGTCQPACSAGFGDCDSDPQDGCETPIDTIDNCGACGTVCPSGDHASAACTAGACGLVCDAGYGDDGDSTNGCETPLERPLTAEPAERPAPPTRTAPPPPSPAPQTPAECASGFSDCDAERRKNGCEEDILASATDCGGTCAAPPARAPHAAARV
ncbi:MAG: hypothetical protein R3B70_08455 [Polyangiaceae bacterium]